MGRLVETCYYRLQGGKLLGERRDFADGARGKVVVGRDEMLQTLKLGKGAYGRDVMLQTVQGI